VRTFTSRLGREQMRALEGRGFDRELWRELASMGVPASAFPKRRAGGLGVAGGRARLPGAGRALARARLVWSQLAAELVTAPQPAGRGRRLNLTAGEEGVPGQHLEALVSSSCSATASTRWSRARSASA
jgi:hypothetical protein